MPPSPPERDVGSPRPGPRRTAPGSKEAESGSAVSPRRAGLRPLGIAVASFGAVLLLALGSARSGWFVALGGLAALAAGLLPVVWGPWRRRRPWRPRGGLLSGPFGRLKGPLLIIDEAGRVVEANAAARNLTEQTRVEGRPLAELGPSWAGLASELDAADSTRMLRFDGPALDGGWRTLGFYVHPVDPTGRVRLLEGLDRTELLEVKEQLSNARRLESIGNLASGVAHDFNNMLTTIATTTGLLREELRPGGSREEARELVEIVADASGRAASLTRKLLTLGRRDETSVEEVLIDEVLLGVIQLLQRTLDPKIEVTSELRAKGLMVLVDRGALEHALVNLAVNGRDAMPEGGRLHFGSSRLSPDRWRSRRPDSREDFGELGVEIWVTDTGQGMTEDVKRRVFDPFFTTKARGQGSGLGLPAVYSAIRSMSGVVDLVSQLGEGTTVRMSLPAREAEVYTPLNLRGSELFAPRLGGRALVVEADDEARARLVDQLRWVGLTPVEAASVEVAVERAGHHRFDVVLCDHELGRSEMARGWMAGLRERSDGPTVIFLAEEAGAADPVPAGQVLLTKTMTRKQLRRSLLRAMNPGLPPPSESEEIRS